MRSLPDPPAYHPNTLEENIPEDVLNHPTEPIEDRYDYSAYDDKVDSSLEYDPATM